MSLYDSCLTYDEIVAIVNQSPIKEKAIASEVYAQNLYAAMCNMQWQRAEMWPILKGDQIWSVSWRTAGGIIAEIREMKEDYMTWYCTGLGEQSEEYHIVGYVSEGTVTDEIAADMLEKGWVPLPFNDDR